MAQQQAGVKRFNWRKWALGLGLFLILVGLVGGLLAPRLLRPVVEKAIADKLHRTVTLAELSINPYALSVRLRGLSVAEKEGQGELAGLDELYLDVSSSSLFRLAPVVSEVRLNGPRVHLARLADQRYNISDLIEEFLNKPDEPSSNYAIHNIRVSGARLEFEDQPAGTKHLISELELGVPFVSNLPSQVDVFVQPYLKTKVNGAPVAFGGKLRPFAQDKVAEVSLDLADVDLTRYLSYVPIPLAVKLPSARLDSKLQLNFVQAKDKPAHISLTGELALRQLDVRHQDGRPILKTPSLTLRLKAFDPAGGRLDVERVLLEAPELNVARLKDGSLSLAHLVTKPARHETVAARAGPRVGDKAQEKDKAQAQDKDKAAPLLIHVGEFRVSAGKLAVTDLMPDKPVNLGLESLELRLAELDLQGGNVLGKPTFSIGFKGLRLIGGGDKAPLFSLAGFALGGHVEGEKHQVMLGELSAAGGKVLAQRDVEGRFNAARYLPSNTASRASQAAQPGGGGKGGTSAPWTLSLDKLAMTDWSLRLADRMTVGSLPVDLRKLTLRAEGLSTAKGGTAKVELKGAMGKRGSLTVSGHLALAPLSGKFDLNLKALDLVPLQGYFLGDYPLTLSRGMVESRGGLNFEMPAKPQQTGNQAIKAGFKGELAVLDLAVVDKISAADLLKWKSLRFNKLSAVTGGKVPLDVSLSEIALGDFFARLVVNPDGGLAVKNLSKKESRAATENPKAPVEGSTGATSVPGATSAGTGAANGATGASLGQAKAADGAAPAYRIKVDKLSISNGRVNFTDLFIKPNYVANIIDLAGSVTGLSSEPGSTAEVNLGGTVDGTAPLGISGRVNPLAKELYLDIKASAKGVELASFSPYAARYAGYAIEKGKLSLDIHYSVENRKLQAENHLFLDQLTFGQKIDSPDATKLPVQLAVALLKNSKGEIDINLPIGGSLDDPQFSVGGIVVKVIVNLIVKAVTAPFALLGNLFGGGEELGWLEFDAGRATIPPAGEANLQKLAKALTDRPGLKLEISGRVDPLADRDGLKRNALDRKLRAQKLKDAVKNGEESGPLAEVTLSVAEKAKYLPQVYKAESFSKPRNLIGMAKDLPAAEMEKLILENTEVTPDALQTLAAARAKAVADWMVRKGQIPAERVFVVSGKVPSSVGDQAGAKARLSRADFSLK